MRFGIIALGLGLSGCTPADPIDSLLKDAPVHVAASDKGQIILQCDLSIATDTSSEGKKHETNSIKGMQGFIIDFDNEKVGEWDAENFWRAGCNSGQTCKISSNDRSIYVWSDDQQDGVQRKSAMVFDRQLGTLVGRTSERTVIDDEVLIEMKSLTQGTCIKSTEAALANWKPEKF